MFTYPWRAAARAACVALVASSGLAQIITSPSGDWSATLDAGAPSGRNGQLTNLSGPNGGNGLDNLFETLWYEATTSGGMLTRRVETMYSQTSENIEANSASFELLRNDGRLQLDVSIDMLDGPTGGAMHDLLWTNVGADPIDVKPFAYADLDVDGAFSGQDSRWLFGTQAVDQINPMTGGRIWFGATGGPYKSWEIAIFAGLRDALDGGVAQLSSSGGGGGADFSSAVSGQAITLQPGDAIRLRFGIGGAGMGDQCDPCDMNCDGEINALDIEFFIDLLFNNAVPCCGERGVPGSTGDINGDGNIDALDIEGFIACLFP